MVMKMDEGLDTGPWLAEWRIAITDSTTTGDLQPLLAREGAALMAAALARLASGPVPMHQQPAIGVTYAKKILADDARIDWTKPAQEVLRLIHGLNPAPGAWTMAGDTRLKLLRVKVSPQSGEPGTVIGAPLTIACGSGAIDVVEIQRAGARAQQVADFLNGFPMQAGAKLI
jgi:methionyl-tRNA formyltransferase